MSEELEKIESTESKYQRYEKLFKSMLSVDFHNSNEADVATVASKNFILYSASVIIGRSIPDLRDGLKPSQRRAMYSMKGLGISHSGGYKKAARITGDCLVSGTKISTEKGLINIEDINVGDNVFTQQGLRKVTKLFYQPEQNLLKITPKGNLYANKGTLNHKVKILNKDGNYEFKPLSQLKIGDYLVMQPSLNDIKDKYSKKECYALGQLMSDGYIDRYDNTLGFISKDIEILNNLKEIFNEDSFLLKPTKKKVTGKIKIKKKKSREIIYKFKLENKYSHTLSNQNAIINSFSNKNLWSFLSGFIDGDGFIRKNSNEIIITSISKDFLENLAVLIFDRFGVLSNLQLSTKAGTIHNGGIIGRNIKSNYNCYNLSFTGKESIKLFQDNLNLIQKKKKARLASLNSKDKPVQKNIIPFFGEKIFNEFSKKHLGGGWYKDQKGKKFRFGIKYPNGTKIRYEKDLKNKINIYSDTIERMNILEKLKRINIDLYEKIKDFLDNKVKFLPVIKIEEVEPEITYDFTVEDKHEFFANGIVSSNCIGKYHPHGDISVYDTMVKMSQSWKQNITLVDGQGNWGSIDGDNPANQRYTEARMTKAASIMFRDIDKNTVDFIPNYDGLETEPTVLPSPMPMILVNGVPRGSIAVGMASSILPHNMNEIIAATRALIKSRKNNEEFSAEDFLSYVPAPDFPTGGIVYNTSSMLDIIKNGRGSVRVRAKHHIETEKKKNKIIVTEIPWSKVKTKLIQQIVDLKQTKKDNKLVSAITNISDQSTEDIRIVIEVKNGWDPELVWNFILKNTDFDTSLAYTSIVIDQVEDSSGNISPAPREYGLLSIINRYLDHRFQVVNRKYVFIKEKSEDKLHIVEGILKALDQIDKVIETIKKSRTPESATRNLMENFDLSERQSQAILSMRLSKLTSIQKKELVDQKRELKALIKECLEILGSYDIQCELLDTELKEISEQVGFERRSEIKNEIGNIDLEAVIPKEDCIIYLTHKGYVKRVPAKYINSQNRGTKGKRGIELTEGDFIHKIFNTNSHSNLLFITDSGTIFGTKAYNIPDTNRGSYIQNIIEMDNRSKIVEIIEVEEISDKKDLILFTKKGNVKRSSLIEYSGAFRKNGIIGISLTEEDIVTSGHVISSDSEESVVISTHKAKSIRFSISEVNKIGRSGKGVRGIKLKDDDFVIKSAIIGNEKSLICTITEHGMAKVSYIKDYKEQSRAGVGVICMSLTKKSGNLISLLSWNANESKDLVTITDKGIINKIAIEDINPTGRVTKGVKLVNVNENDFISTVILTDREINEDNNNEN